MQLRYSTEPTTFRLGAASLENQRDKLIVAANLRPEGFIMKSRLVPVLLLTFLIHSGFFDPHFVAAADDSVPLTLSLEGLHDITASTVDGGVVELQTTGSDPFLFTNLLPKGTDLKSRPILAFEYFSLTGTGEIQVFVVPPTREESSVRDSGLSRSEGWSAFRIDLTPALTNVDRPVDFLRIDFGSQTEKTVRIRNIVLRGLNESERALAARKAETDAREAELEKGLQRYLSLSMESEIEHVSVDASNIEVTGSMNRREGVAGDGEIWLAEFPVYAEITDSNTALMVQRLASDGSGKFSRNIARYAEDGRDRLLSRWAVAEKSGDRVSLLSHGHYADTVAVRARLAEETPKGRKGLGAFSPDRPIQDVTDLGSSAVTINLVLQGFLHVAPGDGRSLYEYGGRTWYVLDGAVAHLDESMRLAAELKQIVSAILLIGQAGNAPVGSYPRMIAHPDADPAGIYVMPNLTTAESATAYGAVLNFLAERYSRPDGKFGRIHHWIMHNEVNSGWVWTNMGEKSALRYMDAYHKSMRMAQLIAWQYDAHAKVYISLEHHWNSVYNPHCYRGKELLELLLDFSRTEGDFPWALAYHPYPENLRNPRAWEDETAWFSYDTPRITFKNIEVLDAWVKRPEARYLGMHVRDIQFTEQGPNSPDYSETSLSEQAACMAYVWKKMEALDSISMFHFHNWVDNRHEGGLRIGLRRYPDDEQDPLGKKHVWFVFQAMGTPQETEVIDFAKNVIGIRDLNEVIYRGTITETKAE
jgi:hypothetical protein